MFDNTFEVVTVFTLDNVLCTVLHNNFGNIEDCN